MEQNGAIERLELTIRSIQESIWLIDIASQEIGLGESSPSFQSRIAGLLIDHLKESIDSLEQVKSLVKQSNNDTEIDSWIEAPSDTN